MKALNTCAECGAKNKSVRVVHGAGMCSTCARVPLVDGKPLGKQATGQLDTLPPGVRSWDDPIMCFDGRGWTDGVWIETNETAEVRAA